MLIIIDYDETFTAHKSLWSDFINSCRDYNIPIVCCTARESYADNNHDIITDMRDLNVHIVFAGKGSKWDSIEEAGYIPENAIWIDDRPMNIFSID